jgi:hypothetical protein
MSARGLLNLNATSALVGKAVELAKNRAKKLVNNNRVEEGEDESNADDFDPAGGADLADVDLLEENEEMMKEPLYRVQVALEMTQAAIAECQKKYMASSTSSNPSSSSTGAANLLSYTPPKLLEAFAELLAIDGQSERALRIYLEMSSSSTSSPLSASLQSNDNDARSYHPVFRLIRQHGLHPVLSDKVLTLLTLSRTEALELIAKHKDFFPINNVLLQLETANRSDLQLAVLDHLFQFDKMAYNVAENEPFHRLQLRLYIKHNLKGLLPFLKGSNHYPLEEARILCLEGDPNSPASIIQPTSDSSSLSSGTSTIDAQPRKGGGSSKNKSSSSKQQAQQQQQQQQQAVQPPVLTRPPLYRELVYVLGRMGAAREALPLLINDLQDVKAAFDFVAGFEDDELWTELVSRCIATESGEIVAQLLECLPNTPLNALKVIPSIPPSIPIPGLQKRLLAILKDRRLQRSLIEGCAMLVQRDMFGLVERLVFRQSVGTCIRPDCDRCALCGVTIDDRRHLKEKEKKQDEEDVEEAILDEAVDGIESGGGGSNDDEAPKATAKPVRERGVVIYECSQKHKVHDICALLFLQNEANSTHANHKNGNLRSPLNANNRQSMSASPVSGEPSGRSRSSTRSFASPDGGGGGGRRKWSASSPFGKGNVIKNTKNKASSNAGQVLSFSSPSFTATASFTDEYNRQRSSSVLRDDHHNRRLSNGEFESSGSLPRSREISSSDDVRVRGIEGVDADGSATIEPEEAPFGEVKLRKCPLCSRIRVKGGGGGGRVGGSSDS